jgi:hypothetical protein
MWGVAEGSISSGLPDIDLASEAKAFLGRFEPAAHLFSGAVDRGGIRFSAASP